MELSNKAFVELCTLAGTPDVDLFVSRCNKKCPTYVSWKKDLGSIAVDAFTLNWKQFALFYAFPPFSVILKVLIKTDQEGSRGIIVVPDWPSQPWYPLYLKLLTS